MSQEAQEQGNGKTTAIAKLLNQLNLPTLLAVIAMNGWGIKETQQKGQELGDEQRVAIRQIQELHDALRAFESRQKEALENQASLLRGQTTMFQNQMEVLKKIDQSALKQ